MGSAQPMIATTLNLQLFPARPISSRSCRKPPQRTLTVNARQRTLTVTSRGVDDELSDSFLASLATVADAGDDSATRRLIRKFVKSSSRKASYIALQHLLSIDDCSFDNISHFALPLYSQITEASWFSWDLKLVAKLIALLEKQGLHRESLTLFSDAVSKTMHQEQKVACLYSNLVIFHSKHKNKSGFDDSCTRLTQTLRYTNSSKVRRLGYESLINGFCEMGQPREAEDLIKEMTEKGLVPSKRVLRYVASLYWNLDNSHSKHKNKSECDDSCSRLTQILRYTHSSKVRCQIYESLIVVFCEMGQPREAEYVIKEMTEKGFMPSKRVLRLVKEALHGDELNSPVNGFCEMGRPREAENVIKEMTEKGFMPSKLVLRLVKEALHGDELNSPVKKQTQISWKAPISGWIKLNTDGASRVNPRKASIGGVFRDAAGRWLLGYMGCLGFCNPLVAELEALRAGLALAWDRGWRKIEVSMDSLPAVQLVAGEGEGSSVLRGLLLDIRVYLRRDWEVDIRHGYRESNKVADKLANMGLDVAMRICVMEGVPVQVADLVRDDVRGVAQPRLLSSPFFSGFW